MQFFYTPLEQFDEVIWLSHHIIETLEPYILFIIEIEFGVNQLYVNPFGAFSSTISFFSLRQSKNELRILLSISRIFFHYIPVRFKQLFRLTEGFAHLFFLRRINLFTGTFFVI